MRLLNWNVQWADPGKPIGKRVRAVLDQTAADIMCITETVPELLDHTGYTISADPNYGYQQTGNRRKVILWSRTPWTEIDRGEQPTLPPGRFISGVTGGLRVVGVCIPWRDAHVRTGRRDRKPWEDHLAYLGSLPTLLEHYQRVAPPVIIAGDFNQRIPRQAQPQHVYDILEKTLLARYEVPTAGYRDDIGGFLIDHIATDSRCSASVESIISMSSEAGEPLSDHCGVVAKIGGKMLL